MSTGLDGFLGVASEATYGTFVAPTDFLEFDSEGLAVAPNYLTPTGLRDGRIMAPVDRHKETTRMAGGPISLKVPNKGFGEFLNLLHGESVAPVQQGGTAAHLQTHNIGTSRPNGKSASIQVGKPQSGGTVKAHSYLGCKVTQAVFACALNGDLTCETTIDARDEDRAQSLAVPSYPSDIGSYTFEQCDVTVAAVQVASPGPQDFSLTIPLPLATERFGMRRSALKAEPLLNDYVRPNLTFSAEYANDVLYDHFRDQDEVAIIIEFEGPEIAGGFNEMIRFTLSATKLVGATPGVEGPGILNQSVPVELYDNGTDVPLKIEYQTTDTAIDS